MAYDLILGQTRRNWGSGAHPQAPDPGLDDAIRTDPSDLAEAVRHEIAKTANLATKLSRDKRIPPADFDAYQKFHSAWILYSDQHSGNWMKQDRLNLWNLREINRQFDTRFRVFDAVAKTPIKKPETPQASPGTDLAAAAPPSGHPVAVLLGVGLAIGALTWLGGQERYRPV
jgi:hypothetical protein